MNWLAVGDDAAGQRIDNFLVRILKGVPKSHIYRILRSGEVRVNRQRVGPDARLAAGDELRIAADPAPPAPATATPRRRRRRGRVAMPPMLLRGRRADRARQAGRTRRPRRQRHRLRRHRAAAARAAGGAVPRARPSARPRHLGRAAGREEAAGAGRRCTRSCARATSTSATSCWCAASGATRSARSSWRSTKLRRPATASGACASSARAGVRARCSGALRTWPRRRPAGGAARGRARDRPHAPDPRPPHAPRLSAGRRRQVRRFRLEQGAREGRG